MTPRPTPKTHQPGVIVRGTPSLPVRVSRAFTLIELLVVIGIIAVLVSMAVIVGAKVVEGGRSRATQNVIRVLDESRGAWTLNADVPLPELVEVVDPDRPNQALRFMLIDGRPDGTDFDDEAYPSLTFYTALVMQDESIRAVFEQLDSAFIKPDALPGWKTSSQQTESWAIEAVSLDDAWGQPLRIVHPQFHGGYGDYWDPDSTNVQSRDSLEDILIPAAGGRTRVVDFTRSYRLFPDDANRQVSWVGDADEGMCIGGSAYFYSPGGDGDPGTRDDNVYSTVPRFPVETRDFD